MSTGMGSWRMKPSSNAAGGRTNRFDGAGWASDGSRIQPGGYGNARPPQRPLGQPKPQNQADNPWNQGGMNQGRPRQSNDYMAPEATPPGQYTPPRSTDYPTRSPQQSSGSPRITPSISFAPGTSEEYKGQAYDNWNNNGWASQPRPADYGVDHRRLPGGGIADPGYQRPGQAQPQQSPYAGSSPYGQGGGQKPSPAQPPMQGPPQQPMIPPGGVGNWGNQTYGRPDPFYMDGADPFGGWGGMDQFLGQRAAFVNNINQHRGMTASQGLPPAPMNFNQMWNQAGQMYQQGWQNPLQGLFG